MTVKLVYEAVLIELHKENAPNILLEDFNYLINKAINLYVNKRYNIYDINLQLSDDLRVLKSSAILTPEQCNDYDVLSMMDATYEVVLPSDYLHILNCVCIYELENTYKCYNKGTKWRCPAKRLTADMYSQVLDNFWQRPSYKNPYYYIHNVNYSTDIPTDPNRKGTSLYYIYTSTSENASINDIKNGMQKYDANGHIVDSEFVYIIGPKGFSANVLGRVGGTQVIINDYNTSDSLYDIKRTNLEVIYTSNNKFKLSNLSPSASNIGRIGTDFSEVTDRLSDNSPNSLDFYGNNIIDIKKGGGINTGIKVGNYQASLIERTGQVRYGNVSSVRMEIRYGNDLDTFKLVKVYIDYIKAPQFIRFTLEQYDKVIDTSLVLEFPDYVCQEIINELVHIIMENLQDPRIQTHPVVSLSIANPAQQLTEPVALLLAQ